MQKASLKLACNILKACFECWSPTADVVNYNFCISVFVNLSNATANKFFPIRIKLVNKNDEYNRADNRYK